MRRPGEVKTVQYSPSLGSWLPLCIIAAVPGVAAAGDTIDTRVTFTIADNDLLKGPTDSSGGKM